MSIYSDFPKIPANRIKARPFELRFNSLLQAGNYVWSNVTELLVTANKDNFYVLKRLSFNSQISEIDFLQAIVGLGFTGLMLKEDMNSPILREPLKFTSYRENSEYNIIFDVRQSANIKTATGNPNTQNVNIVLNGSLKQTPAIIASALSNPTIYMNGMIYEIPYTYYDTLEKAQNGSL